MCFYCTQSDILLCGVVRFSRGNKNKLRTFQPQKWKKIRTASLNENLLVLIKKECNSKANTHKVLRVIHIFCLHFFYKKCISVGTQPRRNRIANSSEFAKSHLSDRNNYRWSVVKCILVAEIFTVYLKMRYFTWRVDLKFY